MQKWYVLKTKPHREDQVNTLFCRAHLSTFHPKIRETAYRLGRHHFVIKPLFPSYLFLHIDFDDAANIHMIKYTRGVSKILCADGKPLSMQEAIIQTLKEYTNEAGLVKQQPVNFKRGDPVRVRRGLLKNLIGILEKPSLPDERVVVLLQLMNYKMQANLHWSELELVRAA